MTLSDRTYQNRYGKKVKRQLPYWLQEKLRRDPSPELKKYMRTMYDYNRAMMLWQHGGSEGARPRHPYKSDEQQDREEAAELARMSRYQPSKREAKRRYHAQQPKLFK